MTLQQMRYVSIAVFIATAAVLPIPSRYFFTDALPYTTTTRSKMPGSITSEIAIFKTRALCKKLSSTSSQLQFSAELKEIFTHEGEKHPVWVVVCRDSFNSELSVCQWNARNGSVTSFSQSSQLCFHKGLTLSKSRAEKIANGYFRVIAEANSPQPWRMWGKPIERIDYSWRFFFASPGGRAELLLNSKTGELQEAKVWDVKRIATGR